VPPPVGVGAGEPDEGDDGVVEGAVLL